MDSGDRQASAKMGEGAGGRRASAISCGLHRLAEALGDRAHDRVDYAQPEDEPGLRVLVRDDGGSDLRGDDPTDAQKARQCRLMRASQTPSMGATEAVDARVCVLGAGNCNDLELNVLGQHCHELHLVDLDSAALSRGLANQRLTSGGEDVVELPGGARVALHGDVALSAIGLGFDHAAQNDTSVLVERALAGPNPDLGGSFDVAISTTLLTQLISLAVEALGSSHPDLTDLVLAIRNGHLRLLTRLLRPGGTALLVTDVVSSDTLPELVAGRPDT